MEETRITRLQKIAHTYNVEHPEIPPIDVDPLLDNAEALIFALWMRDVDIPSELTFNPIYDAAIKTECECIVFDGKDKPVKSYDIECCPVYRCWLNPEHLIGYIAVSLTPPPPYKKDEHDVFMNTYRNIWKSLKNPAANKDIRDSADIRKLLAKSQLSTIDLIYIICRMPHFITPVV